MEKWDYLIIGSGFGGSVCALRLAEKGYRVLLLEQGRRLGPEDFPRSNWDLRRWMWLPALGFRGLFKMTFFRHMTVLSGVGLGGGSLVYANTLPVPPDDFFAAPSWAALANWKEDLAPHYQTVRRMLGVQPNAMMEDPDKVLRAVAAKRGLLAEFEPTDVAVYFGEPEVSVPDPYFAGEGPERQGCNGCGGCMIGCRYGAKNTLDKNYLFLAEKRGLEVHTDTQATWMRPLDAGGYEVTARQGRSLWRRRARTYAAQNVVLAGGVLGTVPLLLAVSQSPDGLPRLSPRLGWAVRTNSEALIGVTSRRRDVDLSRGIAIGAIVKTDAHSHLELARYPAGSGFFRVLVGPHVRGRGMLRRLGEFVYRTIRHPLRNLRAMLVPDWAKFTTIMLYMRTLEGTLRLRFGRAWTTLWRRALVTAREAGEPPCASLPEASSLADDVAEELRGEPMSLINEALLDVPTTAHILGGCCMGASAEEGVVDHRHRVFGYDGLYVVDGSAVSANPGVNPSLTIAALAERAMSFIPPKAERKVGDGL
ncbi:MAG: GMC family oxidoreductase [Deltaproteobacteria bacterium]|nr:GMC family oxidoreductase [Deltaproteobacteria bacterium]